MKYVVLLRSILFLLLSFSPLKGGDLGDYLSHESDSADILFFCGSAEVRRFSSQGIFQLIDFYLLS